MREIRLIRLDETDSTNRYLHDYQGKEPMVVVTARHQTAGRGQGGNRWEDSEGQNLLLSILVRPTEVPISRQFVLAMADALALRQALVHYTDDIELKWPNDIYWHDRKLSGTLIETSVSQGKLRRMILGTGINVNQRRFVSDAPNPVSLCQITGHETDCDTLLQQVLEAFDTYYGRVLQGDYSGISTEYHAALYRREGFYAYRDRQGEFSAEVIGVDDQGHLHLRDGQGQERCYAFKEVEFVIANNNKITTKDTNNNGKI